MAKPAVLYISYDGMLEPLGQSQVIAYLEGLATEHDIHLISYEKPDDWRDTALQNTIRNRLNKSNINWHPLRYHKAPSVPATLFDIAHGTALAFCLVLRHRVKIIHARSYLPALIGRMVKAVTGVKLLFDMRGFWADERVDGGIWPAEGRVYRTVKSLEKMLLLSADQIVTLTHSSKIVMQGWDYMHGAHAPINIIPTCADLELFKPTGSAKPKHFTLGYVGSVGTWYMFDEFLECFKIIQSKRADARLLIVNRKEQAYVKERLAAYGIAMDHVEITSASHHEVPALIGRMSAAGAIIMPVFSKISSAPTKLAEYLGCGVPCLGNDRVGDMEAILEGENTGAALTDFSPADRERAVERILTLADDPATPVHCREVALRLFSLDGGIRKYRRIYSEMLA